MAKQKQKRSKSPDTRPARKRYWQNQTLAKRKIARLVRFCGMTYEQATFHWNDVRAWRRTPACVKRKSGGTEETKS